MSIRAVVFALFISCCGLQTGKASVVMNLEGMRGSSILNFSLNGSGIAVESFGSLITGFGFSITDGFDPFPPAILGTNNGNFALLSGSAMFSNETNGTTLAITGLFLQDPPSLEFDRFGVITAGTYRVSLGDTISWTGVGTIDLSTKGLTFSDLTQGSGLGLFRPANVPVNIEGLLNVRSIATVPEPSTLTVLGFLAAGNSMRLRRRSI